MSVLVHAFNGKTGEIIPAPINLKDFLCHPGRSSNPAMRHKMVRIGFNESETVTLESLLTGGSNEEIEAKVAKAVWFEQNVIDPCLTGGSSSGKKKDKEEFCKLSDSFCEALAACRKLATESALGEAEWTKEALAQLYKLRFDGGYTGGEEVFNRDTYIGLSAEANTRRRHYANETSGYTIAPMSLSQLRQKSGTFHKRKRADPEFDENVYIEEIFDGITTEKKKCKDWVFSAVNLRKLVYEEAARHVVHHVLTSPARARSLAEFLLRGMASALDCGYLHMMEWPLSLDRDLALTCPVQKSSDAEITKAYGFMEFYAYELCIDPENRSAEWCAQARESLAQSGYCLNKDNGGPGWEAQQLLLVEIVDVIRNCIFPITFSPEATLDEMICKAVDMGAISKTTGRGNIPSMCYLPAKSVLVEGSPRINHFYNQVVYARARRGDMMVSEPANYLILSRAHPSASSSAKTIDKYFSSSSSSSSDASSPPYPDTFFIYDNLFNELIDDRERYSGLFVVHGTLNVFVAKDSGGGSSGGRAQLREFVKEHYISKKQSAKSKKDATAAAAGGDDKTFVPPKAQPMTIGLSLLQAFHQNFSSSDEFIDVVTLEPGDVFVWNNKCPVAMREATATVICVELDYYLRSYLLESEDKERVTRMLSNHVRSSRVKGFTNSYEWNGAHALVAAWLKKNETRKIFNPFLMRNSDGVQLYYNHIPCRLLDEVRGVRHYAGVSQTAVFDS